MGKFDGILGLAWPGISVDGVPTPLQAMVRSLDAPVFAFSLGDEKAGRMMLGGVDSTKYASKLSLRAAPVQDLLGNQARGPRRRRGEHDAGDARHRRLGHVPARGPKDDVKRVAKAVGAKPALAGEYTIACDAKAPDITFVLGAGATTLALGTTSSRSRASASSA